MSPLSIQHPGEIRQCVQGWALSVLLHALAISAAIALVSDLHLVPQQEPFTWEVAVVETAETPPSSQSQPVEKTVQAQADPVKPSPVAQTTPTPPAVQPVPPAPTVSAPPSLRHETQEAKQEPTPKITHEKPVLQAPARPVETERSPVEAVTASPSPTMAAHEPQPVPKPHASSQEASQTAAHTTPAAPPIQPPAAETTHPVVAPPHPITAAVSQPAQAPIERASAVEQASAQEPQARSVSTTKADYGWLAKALWSRVEQLKHYPQQARMNRWEGKVVLRAVIRDDGHLLDLTILQSSGHDVLDHDALEIMKQASPLTLHHPLGRPQVVVQVPISYKLEH